MTDLHLRSYDFRREREQSWRELDALVERIDRSGLSRLSSAELLRLPELYQSAISSLSVARSISLDRNVVAYLESLALRAYFCVYGGREGMGAGIRRFCARDLPAAVRAIRWYLVGALAILAFGGAVGFFLTQSNPDWYYSFMSDATSGGRSPTSSTDDLRAVLYAHETTRLDALNAFASYLFSHNAGIGLLAFALGFAFGVPTVLLLFTNGLGIGALAALYAGRGMTVELWAWLLIHGTTELFAIALCGGAGLYLGAAVAFPDRYRRLHSLARRGRLAATVAVGCVAMFFVAALLEGFARQLVTDVVLRYLIGAVMLSAWIVYFALTGKGDGHGGE
jgi:uncharacterized membrane protein SpoIIM required for sporulation